MDIVDMDDVHWNDLETESVRVVQDWGYDDDGRFYAGICWNVTYKGAPVALCLNKKDGIAWALSYANKNNINTIYYSAAV